MKVKVKVTQSYPTLCDPMGCSPWNSPGQNTRVGSLSLFQGIFPTQESSWGLLHCRLILYQLSCQGNPHHPSVQFSSVAQSCPTLCNNMNCSTPGLPVHHQLPEFTQTHVHQVSDAIQPSHPLVYMIYNNYLVIFNIVSVN